MMHNFLSELEDPPSVLYSRHTSLGIFNDSDSDTSPERQPFLNIDDRRLRPLPYPLDVLLANLVEYPGVPNIHHGSVKITEIIDDPSQDTPQNIARKLQHLITADQCFVCQQNGAKHYKKPGHFKAVRDWIKKALTTVEQPVSDDLIFCQACNMALCGTDMARQHYIEKSHFENRSGFCGACLRIIGPHNMEQHYQSFKHKENEASLQSAQPNKVEKDLKEPGSKKKSSSGKIKKVKQGTSEAPTPELLEDDSNQLKHNDEVQAKVTQTNQHQATQLTVNDLTDSKGRKKKSSSVGNHTKLEQVLTETPTQELLEGDSNQLKPNDEVPAKVTETNQHQATQLTVNDLTNSKGRKKKSSSGGNHTKLELPETPTGELLVGDSNQLCSWPNAKVTEANQHQATQLTVNDLIDSKGHKKKSSSGGNHTKLKQVLPEVSTPRLLEGDSNQLKHNDEVKAKVTQPNQHQATQLTVNNLTISKGRNKKSSSGGNDTKLEQVLPEIPTGELLVGDSNQLFSWPNAKVTEANQHQATQLTVNDLTISKGRKKKSSSSGNHTKLEQVLPETPTPELLEGDSTQLKPNDEVQAKVTETNQHQATQLTTNDSTQSKGRKKKSSSGKKIQENQTILEQVPPEVAATQELLEGDSNQPKPNDETNLHPQSNPNRGQESIQGSTETELQDQGNGPNEATKIDKMMKEISKFQYIIDTFLAKPNTKFSSTALRCMIMYIRNFNGLLQSKVEEAGNFDAGSAFEWSPANFPNRTTLGLSTIDDQSFFHQTLLLEVTRLCKSVQCADIFEQFNEILLVVVYECDLVNDLLSVINQERFIENFSLYDWIDGEEDTVTFLEKLHFVVEFIDIIMGIINRFYVCFGNDYNIQEASKLITYITNFGETFICTTNNRAFNIEDIFDCNEPNSIPLKKFEEYEEALLQQINILLKTIMQTKCIKSETIFERFSQFIWQLLLFEKQFMMVNTAPNQFTCSNNIDKDIYTFKITLSNLLLYRQSEEEALFQIGLLIMFVRNLKQAIIERNPALIFKPNQDNYPQTPVIANTLKLCSDLDIYKLILYREVNDLCVFDKKLERKGCEDYFRKFSNEVKVILEESILGARNFESDDDDLFENACECSCPKFCNE